ncbi:MAG: hypothetical protein KDK76_04040 [Chlamydiia bacterium]|nr:hypothetical protein [Chlamydiia bacterium]
MNRDDNFIIFSDIKRLFFKTKWIILTVALVCGGFGLYKRSQLPVCYKARALFKEAGGEQAQFGGGKLDFFLRSIGAEKSKQGHVLLLSSVILEPVIEKLGLQVTISNESCGERRKRLFREALLAEKGKPLQEGEQFEFGDVHYHGTYPKCVQIVFETRGSFEVRDEKGSVLAAGTVGEKVFFDDVWFTLVHVPKGALLGKHYPVSFAPLVEKVMSLRKELGVSPIDGGHSLLEIEFHHPNRPFAIRLLNEMMETYKTHLETENARINEGQVVYLEKKRNEFAEKMNEHLKSHVAYLKENLQEKGVLNLGQQISLFQERRGEFLSNLEEIELKLGEITHVDPLLVVEMGKEVESLQEEIHALAKERDILSVALVEEPDYEKNISCHLHRLDQIDLEELRIKTGIDLVVPSLGENRLEKDRYLLEVGNFIKVLSPDASQLKRVLQEKNQLLKLSGSKLSNEYIKNQLRLLSLQEGVLKKRLFYGTKRGEEYRGIDLETARKLLLQYVQGRDGAQSKIDEMAFARTQIEKENAEWLSLSSLFPDDFSQEMVREMGGLKKELRKERVHMDKEGERLERRCEQIKKELHRHIEQVVSLAELEKERNVDRIRSIRFAILDLLGQEVALVEKQIEDRIEEKVSHLGKEKKLIEKRLGDIKEEIRGVPEGWMREYQLKFAADMTKGMLVALVNLVESKSIEQNLSLLESKPIDFAQASIIPKKPLLKVFGGVGTLLGALMTFAALFILYLYRGFPLTLRNMAVRGKRVVGPLSHSVTLKEKKSDLEALRRFSLLLKEEGRFPLVVALVLGKRECFASPFAELLSKEGKKVLILDLNFSMKVEDKNLPGLIHYLEGESKLLNICETRYGGYICLGGCTSFGDEMVKTPKFDQFLEKMKKEYDVILLSLPVPVDSSLPKAFFDKVDVLSLHLEEESYDVLAPYFEWEREGHSLTFT